MSTPSRKTSPDVTGMSCVISLPSVDLPHPDSPTRPTRPPGRMSKLTPSTAFTDAPTPAPKYLTTLTTRKSGSTAGATSGIGATAVSVTDCMPYRRGNIDGGACAPGRMDTARCPGARVGDGAGAHLGVCALHGHPACGVA